MSQVQKFFNKKNILFILIFAVVGFIALQIPIAQIEGSKAKFMVYDAFAPLAGAFIGSFPGVVAVFLMQFINFLAHGAIVEDVGTVIRFLPMLFAVLYFARKGKLNLIIPVLAIGAFIIHPIGRTVWYFALFWTIPLVAYFFQERYLLARALGATFTAHAVGGALWIWAFNLPAVVWVSLIPIVAMERLFFALGICISFVVVNNVLAILEKKNILNLGFLIDQKYLLGALRHESKA